MHHHSEKNDFFFLLKKKCTICVSHFGLFISNINQFALFTMVLRGIISPLNFSLMPVCKSFRICLLLGEFSELCILNRTSTSSLRYCWTKRTIYCNHLFWCNQNDRCHTNRGSLIGFRYFFFLFLFIRKWLL